MFLTLRIDQKESSIRIYKLKSFFIPETGETIILKVSVNALRTIDKKGIAAVLAEAKANGNVLV